MAPRTGKIITGKIIKSVAFFW